MARFEFAECDAGVEMRIEAATSNDLLRACGSALCLYVRDVSHIESRHAYPVTVHAYNEKTACLALLNELLLQMELRGLALARYECLAIESLAAAGAGGRRQIRVLGEAHGEPADPQRHPLLRRVRAARLEGLRLRRSAAGLNLVCVLDT